MLTAAFNAPHYFTFGTEAATRPPEKIGLTELGSPRRLSQSCDAAYRVFYCCLPLYDQVRVPKVLQHLEALSPRAAVVGKNSSTNRINEKLKSFDAWTAAGIDQRQALLIELAKDVWKTSLIEDA